MGPGPGAKAPGHEVQIRMDDCTKEPPACGRRTRYVAPENFAGAKQDDGIWTFREMDVTLQNSRQKAEHRRTERGEEFRCRESLFVLDRNPIWMTLLFPM